MQYSYRTSTEYGVLVVWRFTEHGLFGTTVLVHVFEYYCYGARTVQGIVWDKKWGWRMGIETLNPSNFNESQLSVGDPVRS